MVGHYYLHVNHTTVVRLPRWAHRPGVSLSCSICMEDVEPGAQVAALPCMHSFCADCIFTWLEEKAACPICQQQVSLA